MPTFNIPSDKEIYEELRVPYKITETQRQNFRKNGFIKLANVLSSGAVTRLRVELLLLLEKTFDNSANNKRNNRFLSLEMMWLENDLIRSYVLSPRSAQITANLLGVKSVRLYHDNPLAKETR